MAGIEPGLNFNAGLRQLWNSIPGAPVSQVVTADYQLKNKVGLGLNMYNEATGLLRRTNVAGTYAYHLQLNNADNELHFGLSLGMIYERVLNERIEGDRGDISVGRFNQRETIIDADFGAAYTSDKLTLQGAVPNMKRLLQKDEHNTVDHSLFFTAASYRIVAGSDLNAVIIEPKAAFRGVRGYKNMIDVGGRVTLANNQLYLMSMYHSSQSFTFGAGVRYQSLHIMGMYATETSALKGYTDGDFEIAIKYSFLKNKE